ncbi:Neuropeptide FF receptor 2 [Trichoplax sp. H2]|uniref:G-protein coupled receptors family 1 profile domain-containing protein n=1 Tax=Trichoplax adhaerens TaxID=10228 RepID=B3RIW0_TRIAD|nr:hypothetical protein TRIADDRAFT_51389 [Trichoplax adhaerens]EDV29260.1 hypothetical protein TRIADDRAFT_51389 [Trichoplax adhaerens]RDD36596.1 Neuropeptide FF receptor 2 [Trichoplax sp. H2]|eukprot:XP_002108462.1 hypothetical protein TRIADDRAFT_51389 [Trichoplax adhaerens]
MSSAHNISSLTIWDIYVKSPSEMVGKVIVNTILLLFAMIGNIGIIVVLLKNKRFKVPTNERYIISLAFADLIVALFYIPVNVLTDYYKGLWILGPVACKLLNYIRLTAITNVELTLVAVAVDRYLAICRPLYRSKSPDRTRNIIIGLWVLSAVLMTPYLYILREEAFVFLDGSLTAHFCIRDYGSNIFKIIMVVFQLTALYIIPLMIVILSYFKVSLRIRASITTSRNVMRKKQRAVICVIVITLVFIVCWTPVWTVQMYKELSSGYYSGWEKELLFWSVFVANISTIIHPMIYALFGQNLREKLRSSRTTSA